MSNIKVTVIYSIGERKEGLARLFTENKEVSCVFDLEEYQDAVWTDNEKTCLKWFDALGPSRLKELYI